MKQFNMKPYGLRVIVTLFLLFALQAFSFPTCGGNKNKNKKESSEQEEVPNIIEVDKPIDKPEYFHTAVGEGKVKTVEIILDRIKDSKEESKEVFLNSVLDGTTALAKAIKGGYEPIVRLLVQQEQIDINKTGENRTSLVLALECCNNEAIAHILLTESGDKKLNVTDICPHSRGTRPVHLLAAKGYLDSLKALLKPKNNIEVNEVDGDGDTPLYLAIGNGHVDVAKYLMQVKGIDLSVKNKNNRTPLHLAASEGHLSIIEALLETGNIDVNVKDKYGYTALHLAAYYGFADVVKVLLQVSNIDVNAQDNGDRTALHLAAVAGHLGIVEALLKADADVTIQGKKNGNTALHLAVKNGHVDVVKRLLQEDKLNLDTINDENKTPLDVAFEKSYVEIEELLRRAKNNINANAK